MCIRHVLDGFERNDDIDGSIREWDLLSRAQPGVQPVLASGMKTDSFGDVHSNYLGSAGLLECGPAVALAACDVQNSLAANKARGECVPVNMLPERKQVRILGHHPFAGGFENE